MGAPFSLDPSATAAFAKLEQDVGAQALHDTAAPVKAVVIGGGTGRALVSIRTLLSLEADTSAVVAMADDGGSTGILREEAGVLPPGDIRKCLVAMAADEDDPLTRAFKYRFSFARNHTLGNLMLSALEESTGSFPEAIDICSRLLNARGRVFPSTLDEVRLCAATWNGCKLDGQAKASHSDSTLYRVWLESAAPVRAYEPALDAIREADFIVLGPGSLFTSILPNLLVPGVVDAIRDSHAATLFACSLADQQGETRGMTALEHYEALCRHGMEGLVDYMLVHSVDLLILAMALAIGLALMLVLVKLECMARKFDPCAFPATTPIEFNHAARSLWFVTSLTLIVLPGMTLLRCAMRSARFCAFPAHSLVSQGIARWSDVQPIW